MRVEVVQWSSGCLDQLRDGAAILNFPTRGRG